MLIFNNLTLGLLMNKISEEIQKEIQLIVNLLQVTYFKLSVDITPYREDSEVRMQIAYENSSGKATIVGVKSIERSVLSETGFITYTRIYHSRRVGYDHELIDLGSKQEYFENIIHRLVEIVNEYRNTIEVQNVLNLLKRTHLISEHSSLGFGIYNERSSYDEGSTLLSGVELRYLDTTFDFGLENNKLKNKGVWEISSDDTEYYKMNEIHKKVGYSNFDETIRSAEKLYNHLLHIIDRVKLVS